MRRSPVDVMVVGRRVQQRWMLAGVLGLDPADAAGPELAASRLAHPSTEPPDVVVLVVEGPEDLAWLRTRTRRSARARVPVVAVVGRPQLVAAARAAGARAVTTMAEPSSWFRAELRRALDEATAPAVVIHLDAARSA